jgi:alkylation response protein AidB-like acyl-CoA dehydrogenase
MTESEDIIKMLVESAGSFLGSRHTLDSQKGEIGQPLCLDRDLWSEMAQLGWLGLSLPERASGSGMGAMAAAALCEQLGQTLFPQPYIAAALMPAAILSAAESTAALELAQGLASGEELICLAWQEQAGQVDLPLPTTRLDNGALHGRKYFVAALEPDSVVLVSAESAGRLVILAVDAQAPGLSIERSATAQGSYCTVYFDGVQPRYTQALLTGGAAETALQQAIDVGRIATSAQLAGIARACLQQTVDYIGERMQFGRPIASFQAVRHRCVDLRIQVELAAASWRQAAAEFDSNPHSSAESIYAAKARCGDAARDVGRAAVQLHGAMGFTVECDIGLYLRAALQYAAWLGSPVAMRRNFMRRAGTATHAATPAQAEAAHV